MASIGNAPIGRTRLQYSSTLRLCVLVTPRTLMQKKPTAEQKAMCHMVRAMGKGNPAKASNLWMEGLGPLEGRAGSNRADQGGGLQGVGRGAGFGVPGPDAGAPLVEEDDGDGDGHPQHHIAVGSVARNERNGATQIEERSMACAARVRRAIAGGSTFLT